MWRLVFWYALIENTQNAFSLMAGGDPAAMQASQFLHCDSRVVATMLLLYLLLARFLSKSCQARSGRNHFRCGTLWRFNSRCCIKITWWTIDNKCYHYVYTCVIYVYISFEDQATLTHNSHISMSCRGWIIKVSYVCVATRVEEIRYIPLFYLINLMWRPSLHFHITCHWSCPAWHCGTWRRKATSWSELIRHAQSVRYRVYYFQFFLVKIMLYLIHFTNILVTHYHI